MSVAEWVVTVILEARNKGVAPARAPDDDPRPLVASREVPGSDFDHEPQRPTSGSSDERRRRRASERQLADVHDRLELLSLQVDRLAQAGTRVDHAPQPASAARPDPLAEALAEIAERQRMLDGEVSLARADLPRAPTQGLSSLEAQLRCINARIDTLRPCGIVSAVETLRNDLAEIGLMIKEAMPRQAIEALETEVRSLAERIDSKRHAGADAANLAGVERGLAEVRDALRALTPAENLAGFDDAVRAISQKIDGIGPSSQDPAAFEQLESAIAGLRGIVSHVASNDTLAKLSEEVRALADEVEQVAGADVLATLEQRITLIADALAARNQSGPEALGLQSAMLGLSDKLERLQLSRGDHAAVSVLEDRIAKLVEKLDSSDARLSNLEAIERGLADLLSHLEQRRRAPEPARTETVPLPEVDMLKRDVQRTQDSIEAVHGTLGHVVDRLAMIETGLRSNHGQRAAPGVSVESAAPEPQASPASAAITKGAPIPASAPLGNPAPATDRRPIDPDLPPDYPIEPGSPVARCRSGNSPADRIAASEAALGTARPPVIPDPDGGKPNFIAAARRAAQAASGGQGSKQDQPRSTRLDAQPASRLSSRIRALLLGASVMLIVLGSLQVLTGMFSSRDEPLAGAPDQSSLPDSSAAAPPAAEQAPPPPSTGRQSMLLPGAGPFSPPSSGLLMPREPAPPRQNGDLVVSSASSEPPATGSVRPPSLVAMPLTTATATAPTAPAMPSPATDKLQATIGGAALRAAAIKGDPTAEFEVAVRLAEGRGVPQDLSAAAQWFERAARQGLAPAQFRLGGLYEKGLGVKKDLDGARRHYLAAAQAGNAKAMHNLAVLYAEGIDGKPDYQTAAKWFRKAADHGMTDSQYNLGVLFARGIGLEVNLAESYKWFALAARDGDREAAKKRDDVGGRLDHATLTAARAAVQAWAAQPQPEGAAEVKEPAGGWDSTPAPSTPKRRVDVKAQRAAP